VRAANIVVRAVQLVSEPLFANFISKDCITVGSVTGGTVRYCTSAGVEVGVHSNHPGSDNADLFDA
jgi:hypothetical protein